SGPSEFRLRASGYTAETGDRVTVRLGASSIGVGATSAQDSRSAAGAPRGTAGLVGAIGSMRRYSSPCSGRWSGSPLFGQSAKARSACAVMVSDGLTPRFAEIAEPSTTDSPG